MFKGKIGLEIEGFAKMTDGLDSFCNKNNIRIDGDGSIDRSGKNEEGLTTHDEDNDEYDEENDEYINSFGKRETEFNGLGLVEDVDKRKDLYKKVKDLFNHFRIKRMEKQINLMSNEIFRLRLLMTRGNDSQKSLYHFF